VQVAVDTVQLDDIFKLYQTGDVQVQALGGVTLRIAPGELVAIMGPSGSGKSTLMNIIGCLDRPTTGRYSLAGQDISRLDKNALASVRNRQVGFVFQSFNLLTRTSAVENVELPLLYAGVRSEERTVRARAALERVGLGDRLTHHPSQMSGGQQQRVAIARALVSHPHLVLADEPTGNLDSQTSLDIMALFQELNRSGMTIILVTHEPDIAAFAARIITMRDGRIQSDRLQTSLPATATVPSERAHTP